MRLFVRKTTAESTSSSGWRVNTTDFQTKLASTPTSLRTEWLRQVGPSSFPCFSCTSCTVCASWMRNIAFRTNILKWELFLWLFSLFYRLFRTPSCTNSFRKSDLRRRVLKDGFTLKSENLEKNAKSTVCWVPPYARPYFKNNKKDNSPTSTSQELRLQNTVRRLCSSSRKC